MAPFGNFSSDHADHVYVSGVGFLSGRDPFHFVERDLRRIAVSTGFCLLLLLLLPTVVLWPVEIFSSVNNAVISMIFGSGALTAVAEVLRELQELIIAALTWLMVLFLLRGILQPPSLKAASTLGAKRSTICALLITAGMTAMISCGTYALEEIMETLHLIELSPGRPMPDSPAAIFVHLTRMILMPAVFEELLFRGCLMQALRRHGDSFALFFSSLCGGLIHYTVTSNLSGFVMGLIFGYFMLRTGSIRTAICCHVIYLALPYLPEGFQSLLGAGQYQQVWLLAMVLLCAAGLAGFVLFCRWNHNAFILDDSRGKGMPFRRKLSLCLTSAPMLLAVIFWLAQAVRNLQVIS